VTPDQKLSELRRIGYHNPNGSKLFRSPESEQQIAVARAERLANKERRKAERDRKRDQRRKQR
jgi:hypothetical protein